MSDDTKKLESDLKDQTVKIFYSVDSGEEHSLSLNLEDKFSMLKKFITVFQKINLEDYDIYFNKRKILKDSDKKTLKEFAKESKSNQIRLAIRMNKLNQITKQKEVKTQVAYNNKVQVENFPSRIEIYHILDDFLKEMNLPKEYHVENKGSIIEFLFSDSETCYEFLKYIHNIKVKNSLYSKIRTNVCLTSNPQMPGHGSANHRHIIRSNNSSISLMNNSLNESIKKKEKLDDSTSPERFITEDNSLNTLKKISGHYMLPLLKSNDESQRRLLLHNKRRDWMAKDDFNRFVGKATLNKRYMIPNYVNLTPSEPPLKHRFRNESKDKWVAKSNFIA